MQVDERGDLSRDHAVDQALDRIVLDGAPRLHRTWPVTVVTGIVAGMEVGLGVLALLYVRQQTGSQALAGLAFSIGFMALLLGRSELFTEGFLTPVAVVAAKRAGLSDAVRLWSGTLAGNLGGGMLIAWFAMRAFPSLHHEAVRSGAYFVAEGWSLRTFSLAVLAGMSITLMTRMHNGTDSVPVKLAASVAVAFLLAGLRLFHSILDSLLIFFALQAGSAHFGYEQWLRFFGISIVGNVVGGVGLTTLFRLIPSRQRIAEHREAVEGERAA
ncbi:MAG TPA: formate/nitrite transporter family protein [Acidimicrobiales bacterium]|nr:formate/nitrite transporter family protein [Acidimicrobiales bacterium]